ncbi:MAG: methylated-DNA--[protein]-cysteine S-methyltransferase [Acidimicrobiales bacterium]
MTKLETTSPSTNGSKRERSPEATRRVMLDTPIGVLTLEGNDEAVTRIDLPGRAPVAGELRNDDLSAAPAPLAEAAGQLSEYFAGRRTEFDLPLELTGTPFQRQVWLTLADIPYGETVSYAELATMVGRPKAFRAVGQANGSNPVPIVLPCHRVVASGGGIGGYGGGLDMKRHLLALEGVAD